MPIFDVITRNQTVISCIVAIVLPLVTTTVSGLLQRKINSAEEDVSYMMYRVGYKDGLFRSSPRKSEEVMRDFSALYDILTTLKISSGMVTTSSLLHFLSSIWTLFKGSDMSKVVWLTSQALSFGLLIAGGSLPYLKHRLHGSLELHIFYGVTSVDAFITLLLLIIVFVDRRSGVIIKDCENNGESNDINTVPTIAEEDEVHQEGTDSPSAASSSDPGRPAISNTSESGEDNLPPAPPPPQRT